MGRFSPTVLPEGLRLGDILDRALQNYVTMRGLRRQQALEDEDRTIRREDRDRRLAGERAEDLSRPGVRTLADYLGDPESFDPNDETAGGGPITTESLQRVGNAAERRVPIEFKKPPPMPVFLPGDTVPMPTVGGGGMSMPVPTMVPQRAPFMTGAGNVMDPARARKEGMLAEVMDQQMKAMFKEPTPWKPMSRDEQLSFNEENAKRTGLTTQRTRPSGSGIPRMPLGLTAIQKQIDDKQQDLNLRMRFLRPPSPPLVGASEEEENVYRMRLQMYETELQALDGEQQDLDDLYGERDRMVDELNGRVRAQAPPPAPPPMLRRPDGNAPPPPAGGIPGLVPDIRALPVPASGAPAAAAPPVPAPVAATPPVTTPAPIAAAPAEPVNASADLVVLAKKIRADHPEWTQDQVEQELRRQLQEQAR